MSEAKTFQTFHETAAIIYATDKRPDELIPVYGDCPKRSKVLFRYKDASELPISDLEARQLHVEPMRFMDILFQLKKQSFEIIDNHFENKEKTNVTDAKNEVL